MALFNLNFLSPQQKKLQQLQLEEAQAKVDSQKRQMEMQDSLMALMSPQQQQGSGTPVTAGINGATKPAPSGLQPQAQAPGQGQQNPIGAILGNDPQRMQAIQRYLLMRSMQNSPLSTLRMMTNPSRPNTRPMSQTGAPDQFGGPTAPGTGGITLSIPQAQDFAARARRQVFLANIHKQYLKDRQKVQLASQDRMSTIQQLMDQIHALNQTNDYRSSTQAFAGAASLYNKMIKGGKLDGIMDKGFQDTMNSLFNDPNFDKKSLKQASAAIIRAYNSEQEKTAKQLSDLDETYADNTIKFFSTPQNVPSAGADIPEPPEPRESDDAN